MADVTITGLRVAPVVSPRVPTTWRAYGVTPGGFLLNDADNTAIAESSPYEARVGAYKIGNLSPDGAGYLAADFTLPSTTDSIDKPDTAKWGIFVHDENGRLMYPVAGLSSFSLSTDTPQTVEDIVTFNMGSLPAATPHDASITGDLEVAGNVSAATFTGSAAGLHDFPGGATLVNNAIVAIGSAGINADSDGNGVGEAYLAIHGATKFRSRQDGLSNESLVPLKLAQYVAAGLPALGLEEQTDGRTGLYYKGTRVEFENTIVVRSPGGSDATADVASALSAAVANSRDVKLTGGDFHVAGSGSSIFLIKNNLRAEMTPGSRFVVDSTVPGTRDVFLIKPDAGVGPAWTVLDRLELLGLYIDVVSGTPARDAFRFDTTNSQTQIRNLKMIGNVVKQLGGSSLRSLSNHSDAFFTISIIGNWLFGAPKLGTTGTDMVGDTILIKDNDITSLTVDDLMDINSNGSTVIIKDNNISVALVFHQGYGSIIEDNIIELANPALVSARAEMIRLQGDVATIQGTRILNNWFVGESTHAVRAIRVDDVDNTFIDGNTYNLNAAAKFLNATAGNLTLLGITNRALPAALGGMGGDGIEGAGYTSTDTFWAQIARLTKQSASVAAGLQAGSLYINGQMFAGPGVSGGFGFGAAKPQILCGAGSPNGVVTAAKNSLWLRDDGTAGVYKNTDGATAWSAI